MSNIDKRALREAANAANAASWGYWESYKPHKGARGYEVKVGVKAVAQHCLKVDSVFIAAATPATVLALLDELEGKDRRIAGLEAPAPELKMAHLINKFYERYPLAEFKSDTERSAALGYFMAGAELQCFGEFINYAELMGDE